MKKQFDFKKPNGRSFQMLGVVSVILATLVSFAYLMPENSTATETAFAPANGTVPAVTMVSTAAVTTSVTSSGTTSTTSKTVTSVSSTSTSTSTSTTTTTTSLTSTTTTTEPETVSSAVTTTTTAETTTVPATTVSEIRFIAENTETAAGKADESSLWIYSEDEDDEHSDNHQDDECEVSGERIYLGTFKITHYCACSQCCGESTGLTASGTYATAGRTVGASSAFEFGTQLEIDGQVYVVEDRGGFSENTIDIFCDSHEEALEKGSYYTDVYIIAD